MSRLYASVVAAEPAAGLVLLDITVRHGADRGMAFTLRRGDEAVGSAVVVNTDGTCTVARIGDFGRRVPPQVGDAAFFIRR
jgi:hypothetical protein